MSKSKSGASSDTTAAIAGQTLREIRVAVPAAVFLVVLYVRLTLLQIRNLRRDHRPLTLVQVTAVQVKRSHARYVCLRSKAEKPHPARSRKFAYVDCRLSSGNFPEVPSRFSGLSYLFNYFLY